MILQIIKRILSLCCPQKYFGKDKSWLYQRINHATVNGKPAVFTQSELKTLADSLGDLSNRLSTISTIIHRSL